MAIIRPYPSARRRRVVRCSPYAVTKYVDELYADAFARCYGFNSIGLRYFNVFGARQDPDGDYAAVIPKWIAAMLKGELASINGDGETSRDFCYVANAVQANLLAAATKSQEAVNRVYNVAVGERTTLNELHGLLRRLLARQCPRLRDAKPIYREFRAGDVRHSLADIGQAVSRLGYAPSLGVAAGLELTVASYIDKLRLH